MDTNSHESAQESQGPIQGPNITLDHDLFPFVSLCVHSWFIRMDPARNTSVDPLWFFVPLWFNGLIEGSWPQTGLQAGMGLAAGGATGRLRSMLRLLLLLALTAGTAGAETSAAGPGDFGPILREQARRHPQLQPQDCYKLILQACLGSEHAAGDMTAAARWLERELAGLGPGPAEPLVEPISPDGRIVRVHLRAFVAAKGDPVRLLKAFGQTAANFPGTRAALPAAWQQVVQLAEANGLPFPAEAARDFGEKMAKAGYPAVRHSTVYTENYRPAYRVIAREYLAGLLPE
jgi:hypothetical protein